MKIISPGHVVVLSCDKLCFSKDGFAMGGIAKDGLMLYEKINMDSFPSCYDFLGQKTLVKSGDIGCIVKFIGRPWRISQNPIWFNYDIYEILIKGSIRQVFRQNLMVI